MRRPEDRAREGHRRNRRRVVARLQEADQPLLAKPLEFLFRERRPERDVGHDRQRLGEPPDRDVQAHRSRVEAARRGQIGAEKIDGVRDLQRRARSRAFGQHRGRQAGKAVFARRVVSRAAHDDEVHLRHRHVVKLDEPDGQTVAQLAFLNGRQLQRRGGSRRRRPAAVRRLRSERRRGHQESNDEGASIHSRSSQHEVTKHSEGLAAASRHSSNVCHFSGTTVSSTRRSAGRKADAAALTSDGEIARYRARSSLNQSGSRVKV